VTCSAVQQLFGVYVLGLADASEVRQVERHVEHCDQCAPELEGLRGLPDLLALLDATDVARIAVADDDASVLEPSPGQVERLLGAAAGVISRRRLLSGAAAAVILLTGAGVAATEVSEANRPAHAVTATWDGSAAHDAVRAKAGLRATPSGTAIDLTLTGVPPGTRCSLQVRDTDGVETTAASWLADYTGSARVSGFTSTPLRGIASVRVVTSAGANLVRLQP
jgi:hypothetical protein